MYDELIKNLRNEANEAPALSSIVYFLMRQAADAIEELGVVARTQKAVLDKFPRWIPVTERLPESIHENVLCCGRKGGQFVGWVAIETIEKGKVTAFQHGGNGRYITHWMPLPEPPEKESES